MKRKGLGELLNVFNHLSNYYITLEIDKTENYYVRNIQSQQKLKRFSDVFSGLEKWNVDWNWVNSTLD